MKVLVFLHGLLGSSRNWVRVVQEFEGAYQILNLDQRGHGKNPIKPETGYKPQDFAQDIKAELDRAQIKKAILVGHSMGGRNALVFNQLFPERVERLVIEDIGPDSTYELGGDLVDLLQKVPVPFKDKRMAKEYFLGPFGDPKLGDFLYTHIIEKPEGFTWDFNISMVEQIIGEGRKQDLWPAIKAIKVPTLWFRGAQSDALAPDEFQKILSANKNIQGVEIQGVGHLVHFEKPKEFSTALKKFLDQP